MLGTAMLGVQLRPLATRCWQRREGGRGEGVSGTAAARHGRRSPCARRRGCGVAAAADSSSTAIANLGELGRYARPTEGELAGFGLPTVDPHSFADELYVDGGSIFASSVLLVLLLVFGFNRILGIDRLLVRAWQERKDREEEEEIFKARQRLQQGQLPGDNNAKDPSE